MSTDLATKNATGTLVIRNMDDLARLGNMLASSGYFTDARDAAQAGVKVLAGLEMGIGAFAAMAGVYVIKGKPSVGAGLMAAAVKRHPHYNYKVRKHSTTECVIDFYEGDELAGTIAVDDFYVDVHRVLWTALDTLQREGKELDTINLREGLLKAQENVPLDTIFKIEGSAAGPVHVRELASIVKEKSLLRRLQRSARLVLEGVQDGQAAHELLSELENATGQAHDDLESEPSIGSIMDAVKEQLFGDNPGIFIPTGIPSYDRSLKRGGFGPGQLCIIAARPRLGKTTMALNVAIRAACGKHAVGVFSLERGAEELGTKLAAMHAGVDDSLIYDKVASQDQIDKFNTAMEKIAKMKLYIDDRTKSLNKMLSVARSWKRKRDIQILIVDYCQLIRGNQRVRREEQIAEISREMKLLAKQLKIPVVLLSQINRDAEKDNREPRLSDLRESGALEQDADSVTFLYLLKDDDPNGTQLRWCRPKQRSGQSYDQGRFTFQRNIGRITD